jgi:hypothetical protein
LPHNHGEHTRLPGEALTKQGFTCGPAWRERSAGRIMLFYGKRHRCSSTYVSLKLGGKIRVLKLKHHHQTPEKSSRRVKVSHGFFPQKNSQFFYPFFSLNTGQIGKKWPKKPLKIAQKTCDLRHVRKSF